MIKMPDKRNIIISFFACAIFLITYKVFADTLKEISKVEEAAYGKPELKLIVRPKVEYGAQDLKDPFRGYKKKTVSKATETKAVMLPNLVIQGVIWGSDIPQAIINNKVVKRGDTIDNVHIVDISKKGIDIMFEGRQFNLPAPANGGTGQASPIPIEGGDNES
ncbi:MAG: general secretion pathway protein GspB [Candidatus Omnitrophica bacterium]|jgi:hypothetical protein|nr:general secretion pathway protein GspB [Candidatus Omnitrophota bacterium]